MIRMRYKGMTFVEKRGGYEVSSDNGLYRDFCKTIGEAALWIWNMADNSDIGDEFIERIYRKVGIIGEW